MAVSKKVVWKHQTTDHPNKQGQPVGIDLFDDEHEGYTTVYERFDDGTLFPARTVDMSKPKHAKSVLDAWRVKYGLATVRDHRTKYTI